jgi:drug/metabolite transporter (DMT)-like permease
MFTLFLAILSSATIALLFKISEGGQFNRYRVTSANYFAAFLTSLFFYLTEAHTQPLDQRIMTLDWLSVLGIGIPAGICFFLSFVFYQISVKDNGASLSAMFGKLGILLPMFISVILWHEMPTIVQTIGILIAIVAMLLVNYQPKALDYLTERTGKSSLILLFATGGMAEFSNKLFQKFGYPEDKNFFLFVVFFVAFLCSSIFSVFSTQQSLRSLKHDILMGFAVGIPNLLSSYFLINALEVVPATIAFPAYSSGSIVLVTIGSVLFFKEKFSRRSFIGLTLTLFALLLIF